MRFEVGDYVMRKTLPTFIWQIHKIVRKEEVEEFAPLAPSCDKLFLRTVCTLEGKEIPEQEPRSVKVTQELWASAVEQAPAMLVIAWESR